MRLQLCHRPPAAESAARLSTQTEFIQRSPISIRIVDRDLMSRLDSAGNDQNALHTLPVKFLKLGIRIAGMVDESCKVTCQ